MTHVILLVTGVLIGLLVAAPIGPVNLICIRRTLAYGPLNGFFSGLGGAVGDGVFAVVAAFGLTAVAHLIEGFANPLKLVGGLMLIGFGIHNFRAEVTDPRYGCPINLREKGESTLAGAIASTFALTITNPATLLGFFALFTGVGTVAGGRATFLDAAVTVAGVITGSAAWWFSVTAITGIFHRHIDAKVMRWINHVSGVLVTAFGLVVLADLFFDLFGPPPA
jgi:threonine/homoserine/homoserine lactone efflux protein